jgi:hypothetical protein
MVFGQEPTPGKYVCDIANIVGLQTSSAERQQKFFVTIEDNKQLPEDWCFSADALDDLKKLRRGEKPGTNSKTQFLDLSMFFTACQAQFRLSTNGGPIDSLYHSDNLNIFRDEFSQFWIKNAPRRSTTPPFAIYGLLLTPNRHAYRRPALLAAPTD